MIHEYQALDFKEQLYQSNYINVPVETIQDKPVPFLILQMMDYFQQFENTYIAGGSLISYFNQQHEYEDIDIFTGSDKEYPLIGNMLINFGFKRSESKGQRDTAVLDRWVKENEKSINVVYSTGITGLSSLLDTFDFPVCRIGLDKNGLVYHADLPRIVHDKKFSVPDFNHSKYPIALVIRRCKKYLLKGYDIVNVENFICQQFNKLNGYVDPDIARIGKAIDSIEGSFVVPKINGSYIVNPSIAYQPMTITWTGSSTYTAPVVQPISGTITVGGADNQKIGK